MYACKDPDACMHTHIHILTYYCTRFTHMQYIQYVHRHSLFHYYTKVCTHTHTHARTTHHTHVHAHIHAHTHMHTHTQHTHTHTHTHAQCVFALISACMYRKQMRTPMTAQSQTLGNRYAARRSIVLPHCYRGTTGEVPN